MSDPLESPEAGAGPRRGASGEELLPGGVRRFAPLLAGVVAGVALVGYLRGIGEPRPIARGGELPGGGAAVGGQVPQAVRYDELPGGKLRANAEWKSDLSALRSGRPGVFDPVTRTEAMKLEALADRAKNRAYDGAPPTVPHPLDGQGSGNCLACHGEGLKVGDRVATRVSHPHYPNCAGCHVESSRSGLPWAAGEAESGFEGVGRAGPGARLYPGAPPTVPHATWMREDCLSCHGLVARAGLRTTHPYLTSCLQCHAPSAELEQAGFLTGGGR